MSSVFGFLNHFLVGWKNSISISLSLSLSIKYLSGWTGCSRTVYLSVYLSMYLSLSHCTHCAGCARSSTTWCAAGRARTTSSSRIYTIGRNNLKQDNYSSPSQDIHILQVVINLKAGKLLVVPFPQPAFFSPLMQGHSLAYLPCYKDSSMYTYFRRLVIAFQASSKYWGAQVLSIEWPFSNNPGSPIRIEKNSKYNFFQIYIFASL